MNKSISIPILLILIFFGGCQLRSQKKKILRGKINGVSLVSPPNVISQADVASVDSVGANWVSIIPYAFSHGHTPQVYFDHERQWWGERTEGTRKLIEFAQHAGLKIMLKPHVWVQGDGWTGDFVLETESNWTAWEKAYSQYILTYAKMAEKYHVEMLCIGTEFRQVVKRRHEFWSGLIAVVRKTYNGKLTYAANWDNYTQVNFWDDLDYIGIDSYYPLSEDKTPTTSELIIAWKPIKDSLQKLSETYNKPILFTEYGYKSCDYATAGHWITDKKEEVYNTTVQENAYQALYEVFWKQNWVAGGFLWKWFPYDARSLNGENTAFTPQRKPVKKIIKRWYQDSEN